MPLVSAEEKAVAAALAFLQPVHACRGCSALAARVFCPTHRLWVIGHRLLQSSWIALLQVSNVMRYHVAVACMNSVYFSAHMSGQSQHDVLFL